LDNLITDLCGMLSKSEIEKLRQYLSTQPVKRAFVFGSVARNEEAEESDLDILVEIDQQVRLGLVKFARIKFDLEDLFHRKVDLLAEGGISKFIAPYINKDKVLIYERANG
jgi:uncharacterized protein